MDINIVLNSLNKKRKSFNIYERRSGKYQLIIPILHEDGDMLDIYLQKSPRGDEYIRICDFGMTLMRLSYSYEINTPSKKKIFNSILSNNEITNDNGNLYLDSHFDKLYRSTLQFAGGIQKVCSMDYWNKETIHSAFYEYLKGVILKKLKEFNPQPNITPLPKNLNIQLDRQKEISVYKVDWSLSWSNRQFYLFGVTGSSKAKESTIALLEFKQAKLPFISLIVHENMENLGDKDRTHLTRNADKQYPSLADFNDTGSSDIKRLAS